MYAYSSVLNLSMYCVRKSSNSDELSVASILHFQVLISTVCFLCVFHLTLYSL